MKKLLSIVLSVCLALTVCGAAFAAGEKTPADAEMLMSILPGLEKLGEAAETDAEDIGFFELLLGGDAEAALGALEEEYADGSDAKFLERIGDLMEGYAKYGTGTLTEKEFLSYIARDNGGDLLALDEEAFVDANDDDVFDYNDIMFILEYLGLKDDGVDSLGYEESFFALLFVLNMIELAYDGEEVDALSILAQLYALNEMYENGELTDEELDNWIVGFDLEKAVEAVIYTEAVAIVAEAVQTESDPTQALSDMFKSYDVGLTDEQIAELLEYYGVTALQGNSDLSALAAEYKKNEDALIAQLVRLGWTTDEIANLRSFYTLGELFGLTDDSLIEKLQAAQIPDEVTAVVKKTAAMDKLAALGCSAEEIQELMKAYSVDELSQMSDAAISALFAAEWAAAVESMMKDELNVAAELLAKMKAEGIDLASLHGKDAGAVLGYINGYVDAAYEALAATLNLTPEQLEKLLESVGGKQALILLTEAELIAALQALSGGNRDGQTVATIDDYIDSILPEATSAEKGHIKGVFSESEIRNGDLSQMLNQIRDAVADIEAAINDYSNNNGIPVTLDEMLAATGKRLVDYISSIIKHNGSTDAIITDYINASQSDDKDDKDDGNSLTEAIETAQEAIEDANEAIADARTAVKRAKEAAAGTKDADKKNAANDAADDADDAATSAENAADSLNTYIDAIDVTAEMEEDVLNGIISKITEDTAALNGQIEGVVAATKAANDAAEAISAGGGEGGGEAATMLTEEQYKSAIDSNAGYIRGKIVESIRNSSPDYAEYTDGDIEALFQEVGESIDESCSEAITSLKAGYSGYVNWFSTNQGGTVQAFIDYLLSSEE